jgi:hypothetical protein
MNDEPVMLLLYVYDVCLTDEENLIRDCKKKPTTEIKIKELVPFLLGLKV